MLLTLHGLFWGWALTHQGEISGGIAAAAAAGGVAAAYLWFAGVGLLLGVFWKLGGKE